ncbi:hypothetical protein JCM11641_001762 [Rhodosporidiobolus odoratus]
MAALRDADDNKLKFPTRSFHGALIALVLSLAVFRVAVHDSGDRYHCRSLLNTGRWLDDKHTSWQPEGCMLHPYSPRQVGQCFAGRDVVFVGDSTVRQVFYATVKHVDKNIDTIAERHSDRTLTVNGITFTFLWDPFFNGTRIASLLDGSFSSTPPALAVIGLGIWYLRHPDSGGINTWDRRIDGVFSAASSGRPQIADEIILLPVENAIESRLSPERAATIHDDDIAAMNTVLDAKLREFSSPLMSVNAQAPALAIPRAFNKLIEGLEDETVDGLHFSESISKVQASILLNLRCNDVLPKVFPFDKTCCNSYPSPNWVQGLGLVVLIAWGPLGLYFYSRCEYDLLFPMPPTSVVLLDADTNPTVFRFFPAHKHLLPLSVFNLSVTLLYLADRTSLFLKENKQYDALTFGILCGLSLLAGVVTLKPIEKDLGFLNRDQTDEWKGWMQIAILIYHYLGASKISGIYNPIRVLVAAYLFMSGYGHLSFFLKKADFGFARVANILVRLNLLTVVLSYLMDTDYLSYYFSPLVTIWFGIIWVTLWLGHKHNSNTVFLLTKLFVAAALTAAYFTIPGPLESTFFLINSIFSTSWNAAEWRFRQTLDMWIVWVGMLTALALIKIKDLRLTDHPLYSDAQKWTIIASVFGMVGYFAFELTRESKFVYNGWHPYVSSVPVLAFIVLRNATPALRSTSSKFFIFFGQCSLETFILQFHLFIAGDTRGIIMMIPGGMWLRPLNFVVTSLVFVFVSNQVALVTGALTSLICYIPKSAPSSRLPTAVLSIPPSATPAGGTGTGEYIALSTVADHERPTAAGGSLPNSNATSGGGHGRSTSLSQGLEGIGRSGRAGAGARVVEVLKTDLRVRFLVIWVGLWGLNKVYPKAA